MNIDFSNFKKIDESDKHATLEHPSGHHLKIAKKGLSEKLRKQLEEMPINLAKGGHAKWSQKFDPNVKKQMYQERPGKGVGPEAAGLSQVSKSSQPSQDPSYNEPSDMGTKLPKLDVRPVAEWNIKKPLSTKPMYPPCINPSCKSYGHSHPNCRCYGGNEYAYENFAEGGEVSKEYYCDNDRPHFKKCEYYADGGKIQKFAEGEDVKDNSQKLAEAEDVAKQEDIDPTAQQYGPETTPPPAPGGEQLSSSQPDIAANPEVQSDRAPAQEAVNDQPSGAPSPLAANPNFGENYEAPGRDPYIDYQQNITNNMLTHAQRYQDDLDAGNIQPHQYFHLFSGAKDSEGKPTALGKIGSVFGLMLSGIGSGLTGQPNAALQIMNNEINNDMKAQELSSQNQQNFLRINQQGLMNDATIKKLNVDTSQAAKLLSLSNQRRTALHYLVDKTQKMPEQTPLQKQQKAAANQALMMMNSQIQSEDNDTFTKFGAAQAAQQAMFGTPGQGQGPNTTMMKTYGPPEMQRLGSEIEQKSLPGEPSVQGQLARKPLNQSDIDQVNNMNVLDSKMKDLIQYSGKNLGSLDPAVRARAQQKANEAVGFYTNSLGLSGTEGNRTWLDEQIAKKNPTSLSGQILLGSQSKLKEIQESNQMRKTQLLKKMGFSPQQSQQSTNNQQPATTSKSGRPIVYKNGKAYYQ